jgi:hypothetical protein
MRKLVTATVSAALCLASVTPAVAQDYRFSGFDAPRGATATANLRVPLGRTAKAEPSYGLSFGMGKAVGAGFDGRTVTRQLQLAEIRFGGQGELKRASLASFDLANLDKDKRMNLTGEGNTLWIVVGLVAAGVAVCLLADCLDGDDDDSFPTN